MGNTVRVSDTGTALGSHSATPVTAGSSAVKVGGNPLASHGHSRAIAAGSGTAFAEDKP